MDQYRPYLKWINDQEKTMHRLVERWANINSGSENIKGLGSMFNALKKNFSSLDGTIQELTLPPLSTLDEEGNPITKPLGKVLSIKKRTSAPIKVFLCGHMDTVFPSDSPFQKVKAIDEKKLSGPGVSDMKGGLVVMLKALEALERSPFSDDVGWEILLNSDEEIGSPGSAELLKEAARRNDIGLIFEPSLPDGTLISSRKGSGSFTLIIRGKSAHVGREYHLGRNAIVAMAKLIEKIDALNHEEGEITANVGKVSGGGPINIVPDFALCKVNFRIKSRSEMNKVERTLKELVKEANQKLEGIEIELHGKFSRLPKPFDISTKALFNAIKSCGDDLEIPLSWKESGGVCDGNILAEAGLPTIDTLGVRGGNIHTFEEYILLDSLTERSRLVALFLMKLATKEIQLNVEEPHESIPC